MPFGTKYLENFLNSYKKNKSGINHELIIVFNGFKFEEELNPFLELLKYSSIKLKIEKTNSKYDIDVYYFIANKYNDYSYFLFLNTYSIILAENWLFYYYKNIIIENVGCVSATGAWGDFNHVIDYKKSLSEILKFKIKLNILKKIIYFRYNFYPSVGIHLRTNAFMINRNVFLTIQRPNVKPLLLRFLFRLNNKKIRSFCFEHGINNFSNQLLKRGYKIKLVNKFGLGIDIENWADSNIFWNGEQENLLIQDNQTSKYQNSCKEEQTKLKFAAWGE